MVKVSKKKKKKRRRKLPNQRNLIIVGDRVTWGEVHQKHGVRSTKEKTGQQLIHSRKQE